MGAVQIGMLRALTDAGIKPDLVVGSSVGAINAAYFAGAPNEDGIEKLECLWRGITRGQVFPVTWRRLFTFLCRRDHLVPADGLQQIISRHLPFENLEDARVPVHVVATDVASGEPVMLSKGPATRAILASTAIPGAFAPVEIDGRELCDGGIASNTPVAAAAACGARRLIVLPTGYASARSAPPRGAVESALHAITLMTARQLAAEIEQVPPATRIHILPAACPTRISPFDFSASAMLIEHAYRSAERWLKDGGLEQCTIPAAAFAARTAMRCQTRPSEQSRRGRRRAVLEVGNGLAGLALPA